MTLLDLLKLMKRSWVFIAVVSIVCALGCFGFMTIKGAADPSYTATATLIVSKEPGAVAGIATEVARGLAAENGEGTEGAEGGNAEAPTVTATADTGKKIVSIQAVGSDAESAVEAANQVAQLTSTDAIAFYNGSASTEDAATAAAGSSQADMMALASALDANSTLSIIINEATADGVEEDTGGSSRLKYALVAFLAGLFVSICVVVVRDLARGTLHSAEEIEETYEIRCLGHLKETAKDASLQASSLLAAVHFACEGEKAVCAIPVDSASSAEAVSAALVEAARSGEMPLHVKTNLRSLSAEDRAKAEGLVVAVASPITESADYAYLAASAGRAFFVVEPMRTRRAPFEEGLRQLAISHTDCIGFVLDERRR